jgi:hypothetical protein
LPGFDVATAAESVVINKMLDELSEQLAKIPELAHHMENVDEVVCTRGEMIETIRLAYANPLLRGYVLGIFVMRQAISQHTGFPFV